MFTVYILSSNHNRHYIGYTSNLPQRLAQHNRKHKGYTSSSIETWDVIISLEVEKKSEAMELEKYLKSFKNSQKAIEYLKRLKDKNFMERM